jgi:AraC-like DNA-binding protein
VRSVLQMTPPSSRFPISHFSTEHLPPERRYEAWLLRDWPRAERAYHTVPTEPFNTRMESVSLDQLLFVRAEITAMIWERRVQDIRSSDFHPIIVNMMVKGTAQGDLDRRAFFEPSGTYHFHDLARPSLHSSTASLTYSLIIPREVAKAWFGPIEDLHGLVVAGGLATAVLELAGTAWGLLPSMNQESAARFERAFQELLAAGAASSRPTALVRERAEDGLRARAIKAIDQKLGLERTSAGELCRVLAVSPDQLSAAFRGDGGLAAWLLTRRLDAARVALTGLERAEPIGNIAHRLGFSDAAHLSRAFRQRFGLSPRDYRKMRADPAPET